MTRKNHSFRLDAGIIDKIEAHRERLQRKVGEAIKITARAALEDLVLRGVEAVGEYHETGNRIELRRYKLAGRPRHE